MCDRCTGHFDHHCYWVNNCIGEANCRWFYGTLVSMEIALFEEGCAAGYMLTDIFKAGMRTSSILEKFDFGEKGYTYLATLLFLETASVGIGLIIGRLLLFRAFPWLHKAVSAQHIAKVHPSDRHSSRSPQKDYRRSEDDLSELRRERPNRISVNETAIESMKIDGCAFERKLGESRFEEVEEVSRTNVNYP